MGHAQKMKLRVENPLDWKLELGIGYNWFDFFGAGGQYARRADYPLHHKVYPGLEDERGWNAIREGLDELRPGFIRFGLPPDPHVCGSGEFRPDTVHMRHLHWLNEWAAANGCTILLDTFVMPEYYEFPLNAEDRQRTCVNMAAEDNTAYAEKFVVPLLKYVVQEACLDAVKYFNPINEPMEYGVYLTPSSGPDVLVHYADMYKAIRQALDAAGIARERLGLIGMDNTQYELSGKLAELLAKGLDIDPYVDAYTIHYYFLKFDYLWDTVPAYRSIHCTPLSLAMEIDTKRLAKYCHTRNKPLFAAEIGTFYYGSREQDPAGTASCDSCLTVAEGVIRGLNQGIGAFAFWSLMNSNVVDGWWKVLDVQDGRLSKSTFPYHVYGLLSRFARPGSSIFPLSPVEAYDPLHVQGSALAAPDGTKAILLVNNHPRKCQTLQIRLPDEWPEQEWQVVSTDRVRLMQRTASVHPDENNDAVIKLNPFSLTVLHG